ncbi:OB-fold domain-containing protein [Streptomyces sp. NPDC006552]|uniref:bifunctional MaoC family dehydratase N-terminal/OB-fold nucleic acid binding domain-containing protein n=1 Tax=Streptomyces sp. NPDC006552 TaxID=3157179 RepID=UPI0033B11F73
MRVSAAGAGRRALEYEELQAFEGLAAAEAGEGRDPVNAPMIRHWCEAMGDTNPAYEGPDAVAPPTMLQAWTMAGLPGYAERSGPYDDLLTLLDGAGYTSVVATDCEQEYLRPLRSGDTITFDAVIESVSPLKTTKLGAGHFVTTRMDVRADGEPAGRHRFRILKYAPAHRDAPSVGVASAPDTPKRRVAGSESARVSPERLAVGSESARVSPERLAARSESARLSPERLAARSESARLSPEKLAAGSERAGSESVPVPPEKLRPRPVVNRDNAGFWEGVAEHQLLIQRCRGCDTLRFPWLPGCNACGGQDWDTVPASGAGTVFSYVVMHHPPFPAFDPPYAVGLIELAEGVRVVSNVVGVPCDQVRIGMPVGLEFLRVDEELELPVFRAAEGGEA